MFMVVTHCDRMRCRLDFLMKLLVKPIEYSHLDVKFTQFRQKLTRHKSQF